MQDTNIQDSPTENTNAQNTSQDRSSEASAPTPALSFWQRWGGYSGLIPFFGLSLLSIAGFEFAHQALISYAALIFSFLGGVVWFVSLKRPQSGHIALVALGSMLWAWCWLLFTSVNWNSAAALSFALLWLYERRFLNEDYGAAFLKLRLQLSSGAALSLLLAYLLA